LERERNCRYSNGLGVLELDGKKESSQAKLLITKNAFCIFQTATAQSKTEIFRVYGVAKAPPGFQAGWSDYISFFFPSLF
jgi:hypothetical protein